MTKSHGDARPTRIQGTDGVRRPVRPARDFTEGPLEVFLKHGVMTEQFFELYCHAHIRGLIESGKMQEGDDALIGWDSRDVENFYVSAAISGIAKAGARPVMLGVLPTPGVAISLVCLETATAIVITASHNPKDHNGIKIFMGPNAAKLTPEEDVRLTERIYATDYETVRNAEEKFHPFDESKGERERFIHFHLDGRNSWMDWNEKAFAGSEIIVDPARGALAGLAAMVFSELGFARVIEVAGEQNGDVNKDSGVAHLEGTAEITAGAFDSGSGWARHELVKKMFEEGRSAAKGDAPRKPPLGASFDADGDRFFVLVYDKENDSVRILSGDESLALQASYLIGAQPEKWRGRIMAFTVESDVNLAHHAMSLGFKPVITAVGDKWILQLANESGESFGLGGEESGHSISAGVTTIKCRAEKRVLTGNGLKGAINTILALHRLAGESDVIKVARAPFEAGVRHTAYAYYIVKERFHRGSEVWKGVEKTLRDIFNKRADKSLSLAEEEMDGEPDMLYMTITSKSAGRVGSIFVRNSGTENKTSVNARGSKEMDGLLKTTCDTAIIWLMKKMTDNENPMATARLGVLEQLLKNIQPVAGSFPGVDFERLTHEMEVKQKLITRRGGKFAITPIGEGLLGKV
jgi:phosphomannomutase